MNILFLTIGDFSGIDSKGIYTDLLREFVKRHHNVFVVCSAERRKKVKTSVFKEQNLVILRVKTGNITKTNLFEKGLSTLLIGYWYNKAIKRYLPQIKWDIVLYSTPPITLASTIASIKKSDCRLTYLLLKDIFPQNAVDLGIIKKTGIEKVLYDYFRYKEKLLYSYSDFIGCMSPANVQYVLDNNPEVRRRNEEAVEIYERPIIEVSPNSIEILEDEAKVNRDQIRDKYGIPKDKMVLIYGGNLGKPQGIPFLLECINKCKKIEELFWVIVGNGTEVSRTKEFLKENELNSVVFIQALPTEEYNALVEACDVGLIFLDHRFTIPNFPSRLLSYLQAKIPVIAATDSSTDLGKIINEGKFGWWCESDDPQKFCNCVIEALDGNLKKLGLNGNTYLKEHYNVHMQADLILKHVKEIGE